MLQLWQDEVYVVSFKVIKIFWGEAWTTAGDLINLSHFVPLEGDVLNKVWIEKDVSYDYLRLFGCMDFVQIPRDEISKLEKISK